MWALCNQNAGGLNDFILCSICIILKNGTFDPPCLVGMSHRFHKLVWGSHGMKGDYPSGSLIAGGDNGRIFIYDPHKMIAGGESLLHTLDKHVGAVGSLDINPFQVMLRDPLKSNT